MTEFYNLGANCIQIFRTVGKLCTHLKQSPTCTLDPSAKVLIDQVETSIIKELSNPLVKQFYGKLSDEIKQETKDELKEDTKDEVKEETKDEVKEETKEEAEKGVKEGKREEEEMENIADVVDRVRRDLSDMNGNPTETMMKLQDKMNSIDFTPIDPENKVKETLNKLVGNIASGNNNFESFDSIVGGMKDFMKSLCPQLDVDQVVGSIMQSAPK